MHTIKNRGKTGCHVEATGGFHYRTRIKVHRDILLQCNICENSGYVGL
jgi:hypothetical protein